MKKFIFLLFFSLLMTCSWIPAFRKSAKIDVEKNYFQNIESKKTITILLKGNTLSDGSIDKSSMESYYQFERLYPSAWLKPVKKAYKDSHLFSYVDILYEIQSEDIKTDYLSEVNIIDDYHSSKYFFLNCLSFGIIPVKTKEDIIVQTVFKNNNGNILKRYEESETFDNWHHMLGCIPVLIYPNRMEVKKEIYYDLNMTILKQAYNDGIFNI